jgi:hypothetical protein
MFRRIAPQNVTVRFISPENAAFAASNLIASTILAGGLSSMNRAV